MRSCLVLVLTLLFSALALGSEPADAAPLLLPIDQLPKEDEVGFFEKQVAYLVTAVPKILMILLNIQDINTLVFAENEWVYKTFPTKIWDSAASFYNNVQNLSGYLLVIAFVCWGGIMLFRHFSAEDRLTARDMQEGVFIYVGGLLTGSFIFKIVFGINTFLILWAKSGLISNNIPTDMKFLDLAIALQNTPSLGGAILFFLIVFSIGTLNYQYALRMLVLVVLIILFPAAAYASIYPWSRRALDIWMREFASQVLENGGHALAFALFLVLMKNGANNWTLFAFLGGLPHLSSLVRILLGAPISGGGPVSSALGTMLGGGSMMSMMLMAGALKGGGGAGALGGFAFGGNTGGASVPNMSTGGDLGLSNMSGGLGLGMNGLDKAAPMLTKAAKIGAVGAAGMAGAMALGAMTGTPSGAMLGTALGAKGGQWLRNEFKSSGQSTPPPRSLPTPPSGQFSPSSTPDPSNTGTQGEPQTDLISGAEMRSQLSVPAPLPTTIPGFDEVGMEFSQEPVTGDMLRNSLTSPTTTQPAPVPTSPNNVTPSFSQGSQVVTRDMLIQSLTQPQSPSSESTSKAFQLTPPTKPPME